MTRTLHIEVQGHGAMLRAWLRRREVFRAAARTSPARPGKPTLFRRSQSNVLIFDNFLHPSERRALHGRRECEIPITKWLEGIADDPSKDAINLRLHEVKWHVIDDGRDKPSNEGIASNDMARRARTTGAAERRAAIASIVSTYDVVRFCRV